MLHSPCIFLYMFRWRYHHLISVSFCAPPRPIWTPKTIFQLTVHIRFQWGQFCMSHLQHWQAPHRPRAWRIPVWGRWIWCAQWKQAIETKQLFGNGNRHGLMPTGSPPRSISYLAHFLWNFFWSEFLFYSRHSFFPGYAVVSREIEHCYPLYAFDGAAFVRVSGMSNTVCCSPSCQDQWTKKAAGVTFEYNERIIWVPYTFWNTQSHYDEWINRQYLLFVIRFAWNWTLYRSVRPCQSM